MEVCIFVEENSIIFIVNPSSRRKKRFNYKPSFFDAVQLSTRSPQTYEVTPYQSIPFHKKAIIPILSFNSDIHIMYEKHSLQIYKENNDLTEKEVFEILTRFAIKEGNRVSFLADFPNGKKRQAKSKPNGTLAESKKMEDKCDVPPPKN